MQSDTVQNLVSNPPFSSGVTLKYVRLQDLTPGLTGPNPAPKIFTYRYKAGIPTSFQWVWHAGGNALGVIARRVVCGATCMESDEPLRRHRRSEHGRHRLSLPGLEPGSDAHGEFNAWCERGVQDLMRSYRGYAAISYQDTLYRRTYHSLQTSYTRRMKQGLQTGLSWTGAFRTRARRTSSHAISTRRTPGLAAG